MKDIEIARSIQKKTIQEIANKLNISLDYLEEYGKYKAKINNDIYNNFTNQNGKLILVTSINPTPLGEGKTTLAIGIADALNYIGKKAIVTLREPSLGPVFGIKGGATGGGRSQVVPMEDINLHFTGDIHAITTANNLLSAMIDNHIFQGNELQIDQVVWKRCLDMNDRSLRYIEVGLGGLKNGIPRKDGFDISVASEIMAIFCLSNDLKDLKKRLGNIVIGYTKEGKVVTANDLKAAGALTVLLKEAFKPNLVQTLEYNPAIIHGGPFANIAHGCNSILATKLSLKLSDYVVTEAGFGADLGAEKFFNIKCRVGNLKPDVVVIGATIKALKYHGGTTKEEVEKENLDSLQKGSKNLIKHIENMKNFGATVLVILNRYSFDTEKEINLLSEICNNNSTQLLISNAYLQGGKGAEEIANKITILANHQYEINYTYDLNDSIKDKIFEVATKIYGATNVIYTDEANAEINFIEKNFDTNIPICIAKTQYSLSDNPKNLECSEPFDITIREVRYKGGAQFITIITGNIMTMPGLPKVPAAMNIDVDDDKIVGIF